MRNLYMLCLIALACIIIGLALADEMTFTTYYPAPAGVYNNMAVMNSLGVGTTNPQAKLDVIGGVRVGQVDADGSGAGQCDSTGCTADNAGTLRYCSNAMQYCDNNTWKSAFGGGELYVKNASGAAEKKNSPKFLLGSVSGLTAGVWRTVSWTNTPFTNIYGVLCTPSSGNGYEFDAKTNGTTNSVDIRPDSNGMTITFLVIGD